jgi:hypothetical protein
MPKTGMFKVLKKCFLYTKNSIFTNGFFAVLTVFVDVQKTLAQ